MKKIAVLGFTGSIGDSTKAVLNAHSDLFEVVFASAHSNHKGLLELAKEFNIPKIVFTNENKKLNDLPKNTQVFYGRNELLSLINNEEIDILLNGVSGSAGLEFTIAALKKNIDVALANKESLVMAGHIIEDLSKNAKLLPVDSEHSAIFQSLAHHSFDEVAKLIITASGGPFRNLPLNEFKNITLEDTLKHPTWSMGAKITVDSATMMNKALEVIEAHWLFKQSYDNIEAIIHPQSIIHSMVEFVDGSHIAQLSSPSMQLPILYALTYPKHIGKRLVKTDFLKCNNLTFEELKPERYPLFFVAKNAGKAGGIMPCVVNAANEAAVSLFLNKQIKFTDIYKVVDKYIQTHENINNPSLEEIIETNAMVFSSIIKKYK